MSLATGDKNQEEVFFCSDGVSEQVPLAVIKQTENVVILQKVGEKED